MGNFEFEPAGLILGVGLFFLVLFVLPFVFFLITQYRTLQLIQPQNRTMSPGEVFLQLIPLFGLVWQFVVVTKIANSIAMELANNNTFSFENENATIVSSDKPTYTIGIAYCILFCTSILPLLGFLTGIAGIVCWIIYWVKLAEYKNQIQQLHNNRAGA
jgi:hypothetical protein